MKIESRGPRAYLGVTLLASLFAVTLIALPRATSVYALPTLESTNSSANCENNDSLFSSSFSCSLNTTAGSAIVVFFGCLSGPSANCDSPSVQDSQNNVYRLLNNVETSCSSTTCEEYVFSATASSTGADTMVFATAGRAFLGADVYDISGINATAFKTGIGASSANDAPGAFIVPLTPYANSFVAAGVIANNAFQFSAGSGYALIPGQPCYYCGMIGGWQASEYVFWGQNGTTVAPFNYPQTNDGWAELALSFAPNVASTSVTCGPSTVTVTTPTQCTATETGASPTGTVTWTTNATGTFSPKTCTLSSGSCSVSYTPSVPSPAKVNASYSGDLNNPASSAYSSISGVKAIATETVTCSPSSVTTGSATTCSDTVSGVSPTGTITWASSGVADFSPATTCTLSAGSCAVNYTPSSAASPVTITAVYSGDTDNDGISGMFALSVAQVTETSTTSSPATSTSTTTSTVIVTSTSTTTGTATVTSTSSSTPILTGTVSATSASTEISQASTSAVVTTSSSLSSASSSAPSSSTSTAASSTSILGYLFPLVSVVAVLTVAATSLLLRKRVLVRPPAG
ncbi:MAG: hypothetical protein OK449_08625 [Thaumarchaeota archaeon]|nr:hypothetical protein [Nitrososphaerota archaeon]